MTVATLGASAAGYRQAALSMACCCLSPSGDITLVSKVNLSIPSRYLQIGLSGTLIRIVGDNVFQITCHYLKNSLLLSSGLRDCGALGRVSTSMADRVTRVGL
jgi:hypothetical protein